MFCNQKEETLKFRQKPFVLLMIRQWILFLGTRNYESLEFQNFEKGKLSKTVLNKDSSYEISFKSRKKISVSHQVAGTRFLHHTRYLSAISSLYLETRGVLISDSVFKR